MARWKITRDGKDIYPGNTGISKLEAMRQAKLFNRWARMNGGQPTYGIRPLKEMSAYRGGER